MFIDDLLIGFILCGLVMSVVYLRVDLLGSRRDAASRTRGSVTNGNRCAPHVHCVDW
jgi:hypothetical protein